MSNNSAVCGSSSVSVPQSHGVKDDDAHEGEDGDTDVRHHFNPGDEDRCDSDPPISNSCVATD